MKNYFDTSVLFPAMTSAHPNHQLCLSTLHKALQEGEIVCLSLHVYAELYANLTRFPLGERISPQVATKTIIEDLGKVVTTIDLTRADYEAALRRCADRGLGSGIIYDALHLQAAIKAKVEVLYTNNLRDFQRLYSDDLGFELRGIQ